MTAVILNIIVIGICVWAIYYGWHSGGPRQIAPILGWGMAIIAVHLATPALASWMASEGLMKYTDGDIASRWLAVFIIYCFISLVVTISTGALSRLTSLVESHVLGGIIGALLTLLRWTTVLSIVLNLWAAADQDCLALEIASGGDGGIVEGVMHLAPLLMGEDDFEETYIRRQLREAKTISSLSPLYDWRVSPVSPVDSNKLLI